MTQPFGTFGNGLFPPFGGGAFNGFGLSQNWGTSWPAQFGKEAGSLSQYVSAAPGPSSLVAWKRVQINSVPAFRIFAGIIDFGSTPSVGIAIYTGGTSAANPGTKLAEWYGPPMLAALSGPIPYELAADWDLATAAIDVVYEFYSSAGSIGLRLGGTNPIPSHPLITAYTASPVGFDVHFNFLTNSSPLGDSSLYGAGGAEASLAPAVPIIVPNTSWTLDPGTGNPADVMSGSWSSGPWSASPVFHYPSAGTWHPTLTVINANDRTASQSLSVTTSFVPLSALPDEAFSAEVRSEARLQPRLHIPREHA